MHHTKESPANMTASELGAPPVLSTPDTHILNETNSAVVISPGEKLSDGEIYTRYEIERTLEEIRRHSWRRVALQFPDEMLPDSARVFQLLARGTRSSVTAAAAHGVKPDGVATSDHNLLEQLSQLTTDHKEEQVKFTVLADTSYGSCCVDEIAGEHVEADAVVHYGRACLSPTARLPVLHVFTHRPLDFKKVVDSFKEAYSAKSYQIVLTADVTYHHHVRNLHNELVQQGYDNIFVTDIIHEPTSPIPNRTVPDEIRENPEALKEWQMFYISEPPTSLLLTLSSRLAEIRIYPTDTTIHHHSTVKSLVANTSLVLRRRYALVTSLATVGIWGILINTLSVKNYLHMVDHVKSRIAAAGKKSYIFVVGKLNAAKVANFSEVGGWVVIGCWESSLIDSKDFYKPVITPFELDLALKRDEDRIWTGDWSADFQHILDHEQSRKVGGYLGNETEELPSDDNVVEGDYDTEEESSPPEFDLRTGRYVSQSRPMRTGISATAEFRGSKATSQSSALTKRANGDVVGVNGVTSPGAQFLQSKRTWKGLGSDFEIGYEEENQAEGSAIEEGRSGIARGYVVGTELSRT
jgi:diphthamide biosynthesis protein 2